MNKKLAALIVIAIIPFLAFPQALFAIGSGGFENASFSAESLAQGNAVVAQADEPAAISYNPAGIVDLPGLQMQGGTSLINSITVRENSAYGENRNKGAFIPVPTGYATVNPGKLLGNRVAFGIGSDSPFGLMNQWNSNYSNVHYVGWKNWLKMYTIKPVVAAKITDWLSIGGGPMYYRIYDFGGIQAYPNRLIAPYNWPDGQVRLNLAGNHWGWQMGALIKPHKKHQLGFYFRSPVDVLTKGLIKVENSSFAPGGKFETGGNAKINLPLNLTFAYAFKPTNRTTVETDFGYTRWSIHKRLYINADPVTTADDAILNAIGKVDKDYNDSYTIHLGGNHKLTKNLTLMGGWVFYWPAVPKDHFTPAVPDAKSMAVSTGFNYEFWKHCVVGLSYFQRFWFTRSIDNGVGEGAVLPNSTVDGKYTSFVQEIAVSFTYKWDDIFDKISGKLEKKEMPKQ
jgi:long-chain fatty acid transport protein